MTVGELKKLKKFLTSWEDRREIVTYQIVETFIKDVNTYQVINMSVGMEDGVVYLVDINNDILNQNNNIKGFLISSAELVELYKDQFSIQLKNGIIKVKVIG